MPDREKVIKGLEVILEETADMFYRSTIQDAMALLKTQKPEDALKAPEPVRPMKKLVYHVRKGPVVFSYVCPVCMCVLQRYWKACPICGKAVKWGSGNEIHEN